MKLAGKITGSFTLKHKFVAVTGMVFFTLSPSSLHASELSSVSPLTVTAFAIQGVSIMARADQAMADGNATEAIALYRQALATGGAQARVGLGRALNAVGRYSEALSTLKSEAALGNGAANHEIGKAYLAIGDYEAAVAAFSKAVSVSAFDASSHTGRGVALAAVGDAGGALNAFDDALSSEPGHPAAYSNKALLTALIGESATAIEMLETMVRGGRAGPRDRQNLALAYLTAGRRSEARAMARLDLDAISVDETFTFYDTLFALPPEARMKALLTGVIEQGQDLSEAGNLELTDNDNRQAAAARLTALPEPEVLPDIPPLLEPEGWAIQIAAYRKLSQLVRGWKILYGENKDILEGIEPRRSEVDFGGRGEYPDGFFFRLNAGPLATFAEAEKVCNELKARGTACWIRPPEPPEGRLPKDN